MAHPEQFNFVASVKEHYPSYFFNSKVLEIGSLNLNGTIRTLFDNCDYLGIDVAEGRGVDKVAFGNEFDAPDNTYDVCISCECFEHNPYWKETFINMHRMCKLGGLVIVTCATTGRAEHGTLRANPQDSPITSRMGWTYYKNLTEKDFLEIFKLENMFKHFYLHENKNLHFQNDLFFLGIKWEWSGETARQSSGF